MQQNIFKSLSKVQDTDEVKNNLELLKIRNIRDKAEIIAKKKGKDLNENSETFAYKNEDFLIDYFSHNNEVVLSFVEDGEYNLALKSNNQSIAYLDCGILWKNLHKLEQKFNNLG